MFYADHKNEQFYALFFLLVYLYVHMQRNESESIGNEGEARLVCHQVARLCEAGVNYRDIAIITPYNLQVMSEKSFETFWRVC